MQNELRPFFKKLFNLRDGAEDKPVIIENIRDDAEFSSPRLWTLVFAIGIASIGLNINSIPLVIGAMLISPLMGPIVSIGMALAINDWHLMRKSFRNFIILMGISIIISAIYFSLSPISNAQSELLARIEPTIFDVLIAIFGGMAGFIGVSRSRQSNVIPGVAIATALMPPLCTIGYGIGTLQTKFIFGALYLFIINSVFICLSALVVSKYLKLPKKKYEDEAFQKRVRRIITAVIIVIVSPAIYLAVTFVERNDFYLNADEYLQIVFEERGYVIIYENLEYHEDRSKIEIAFLSERFSQDQIDEFKSRLVDFDLHDVDLHIRQNGYALTDEEWEELITSMQTDSQKVLALEARLATEQFALPESEQVLREMKAMDTRIKDIGFGSLGFASNYEATEEGGEEHATLVVHVYTDDLQPLRASEARLFENWLKERFSNKDMKVFFLPTPVSSSVNEEVLGVSTTTNESVVITETVPDSQ